MTELTTYAGIPLLIWEAGLQYAAMLLAGGLLGLFATHYLKKRDEVTRVAGVILEKRVNSQRDILRFFENATYTRQVPTGRADPVLEEINAYGLATPWGNRLQYAEIFESLAQFHAFQRDPEELNSGHKLWLDAKVRFHLNLIQAYIAWINRPLVFLQEIELPGKQPLHGEAYERAAQTLLLMQGIVLDAEFKGLVAELETLMVDSIYHLDLRRSRSSLMRDRFNNQESARLIATLSDDTLLGSVRDRLMALAVGLAAAAKGQAMEPEEAAAVVDDLLVRVE
ncbi:hypothetical protein [Spiribacter roseus]|uniref:Uncharacterized protein n=1 Tax=Spiribacter roseus TaxID=1855875 RepID=A0ABV3S001_9GAMM